MIDLVDWSLRCAKCYASIVPFHIGENVLTQNIFANAFLILRICLWPGLSCCEDLRRQIGEYRLIALIHDNATDHGIALRHAGACTDDCVWSIGEPCCDTDKPLRQNPLRQTSPAT